MHKPLLLLASLFVFVSAGLAQEHRGWCKTHEHYLEAYNENPEQFKAIERDLDEAVIAYDNTASKKDNDQTYYIPVVFHYVHTPSEDGQRFFTEDMANACINRFNQDFNRANPDSSLIQPYYSGVRRGNAKITFLLAQIDPDGEPTNGINYYASELGNANNRGGNDDLVKYHTYQTGKFWSPDNYLNIWIVQQMSQPPGTRGELLAYATLPEFEAAGATRKSLSGIIGKRSLCMVNINSSSERHALSHEIGHWLGLRHPFQADEKCLRDTTGDCTGCNDGDCKFSGDKICDIPQVYTSFLSCARNQNSCPNEPMIDNITNIMDYKNCGQMFSRGQVTRMRGTLTSYRKELVSWENLQRVGINDKIVTDVKGKTTVYPNPFSDKIVIEVESHRDVNACIEIRDLLGRSAYKDCKKKLRAGINKIELNAADMNLANDGVYLVEIRMEDTVLISRVQYQSGR